MTKTRNGALALTAAFVLGPAAVDAAAANPAALLNPPPQVDHHMHVFSPAAARILTVICKKVGPVKCPKEISREPSTSDDVVRSLDAAGIRQGVLLSTAYFFASPEAADQGLDVAKQMRAENTYDVDQARAQCGRLVAFISVDPLAPNALSEIAYWGRRGGATGLKLHLANSGFSFRSPQEVEKLAAVFSAAAQYHFPIIVHLQTRTQTYGARDVGIFLKDVLPAAKGDMVQIAHAAGGGGVDSNSLSALAAFATAIEQHPDATKALYFDLAQVPDLVSNSAQVKASKTNVAALLVLMRRIGLNRFLLGSDWTSGLNLRPYFIEERNSLGLSDSAWRTLATNVAPYVRSARSPDASCRPAA